MICVYFLTLDTQFNTFLILNTCSSQTVSCGLQPRQTLPEREHQTEDLHPRGWDTLVHLIIENIFLIFPTLSSPEYERVCCCHSQLAGGFTEAHRRRGAAGDLRRQTDRSWWRSSLSHQGESWLSRDCLFGETTADRSEETVSIAEVRSLTHWWGSDTWDTVRDLGEFIYGISSEILNTAQFSRCFYNV